MKVGSWKSTFMSLCFMLLLATSDGFGSDVSCNNHLYNPTWEMCCNGTIGSRSGFNSACCGSKVYDSNWEMCCNGTVELKSGSKSACCGSKVYNPNWEVCCN